MITKMRMSIAIAALLALAGCDGEERLASTPPGPAPVTPGNLSPSTVFSNSMQSGNFVTVSANEKTTTNLSGVNPTSTYGTADTANLYLSYDSARNEYALNFTSGGSATSLPFVPALATAVGGFTRTVGHPDPTEIDYGFGVACRAEGCPVGTVTHTGSSGFVYTYTAFARMEFLETAINGSGDSYVRETAVFGMPTPPTGIPPTGTASVALDLFGTFTQGGSSQTGNGTGTGKVDFASGTYAFFGEITPTGGIIAGSSGSFASNGTLARTGNRFGGTIDLVLDTFSLITVKSSDEYRFHGNIDGLFFGPHAEELGGAFVAPLVSHTDRYTLTSIPIQDPRNTPAFVGAILGHQ